MKLVLLPISFILNIKNMAELLMSMIIPLSLVYILPLIFGLWYINKEITVRKLNTRIAWMVFLFCAPIIALIIFYAVEIRRTKI